MKGATIVLCNPISVIVISIHAPVKGATLEISRRTECYNISIHAPVKGATAVPLGEHQIRHISIHAPVKGATGIPVGVLVEFRYFNPRSREGSDHGLDIIPHLTMRFQSTLP